MGGAASALADTLNATGSYLQEKKVDHLADDLVGVIRRYRLPAWLIGLGVGYVLGGRTRR
jgi:hypothetical protein